jgi:tRNA A-37 threonylcarbamoyl transferase component Bud32
MDLVKELGNDLAGVDGIKLNPARERVLENLLTQNFGPDVKTRLIQRFKSKKNVVIHIGMDSDSGMPDLVAKMFVTEHFKTDLMALKLSHENGLAVPRVVDADDGVILMDFISGEPLTERINRTFESVLIDDLAKWYYDYHSFRNMIKGDPRLRNFICAENALVGLDFEETTPGHWIIDIGGVSASLLDTKPIFDSRKRKLVWHFLAAYLSLHGKERSRSIDGLFITTVSDALKRTAYWRKDDDILALADQIRESGIPID